MSDRQRDVRAVQQARLAAKQKKRIEINQDAEIIREGKGKLNMLESLKYKYEIEFSLIKPRIKKISIEITVLVKKFSAK